MSLSTVLEHCDPTSHFFFAISATFHSCIPTPLALLSSALGILSIISWLFAQLPQVVKNYKLKSASGLSIYFLAEWLLGDLTNLLGALLTRQAAWQVVVAAYYVTVDICLVTQYFWYAHYKPWRAKRLSASDLGYNDPEDGTATEPLMGMTLSPDRAPSGSKARTVGRNADGQPEPPTEPKSIGKSLFRNLNYSWSPKEKTTPNSSYRSIRRPHGSPSPGISPNTLLLISFLFAILAKASPIHPLNQTPATSTASESDSLETAGRIFSWMSTLLYMGSRLPQILKNYRRRSTAGLSPIMFIAAFFGNLFYSCALLANPLAWNDSPPYGLHGWVSNEGSDRITWVSLAIPFFLGAAGVLAMDSIVGVQFLMYGEKDSEAPVKVVVVPDERGRSQWRKVSGWMRGWVPSPAPRREGEDGFLGRERGYGAI
ncbi:MAG: hypothetical protein L6R38_006962 [Xanthoria sp. 2 TBL-2021]|nr:MAG: hypothetical protein L6R38_006962 [Xanthoria sp. 2 TBL-2021]